MYRYRRVVLTLLTLLTLALASGCSGTQPASAPTETATEVATEAPTEVPTETPVETFDASDEPTGDVVQLTMYFVDPASSPYAQGGEKIAELVREATGGRIQISVEAGSALGERALIEGAMENQIDIATCANSVLTNYIPQMNILDQAYLWKNADEAHAAVDGTLGALIAREALPLGLHVIGFEESGFRNTFSVKPIQSIDDFRGVTIRTMENKYHQAAFEAFGATAVALPYGEVFPALKDGTIDACENATANCLNSGYYEVTKNITNTRHAFVYIVLCMSDEAWHRIPDDLTNAFLEAVSEGVAWERERLSEANREAAQTLSELGVQFYDIDLTALQAAYRKAAREKEFTFDPEWQAAVDEAVSSASKEGA